MDNDLISREWLRQAFVRKDDETYFTIEIKNVIDNVPTVEINTNDIEYKAYCKGLEDGKKIARPQGEWVNVQFAEDYRDNQFKCSECGKVYDYVDFCKLACETGCFPNFCLKCGADMRKEDNT